MTRYQVGNRWMEGDRAAVMSIASALMHARDSRMLYAMTVDSLVVVVAMEKKKGEGRTTCRLRNEGR